MQATISKPLLTFASSTVVIGPNSNRASKAAAAGDVAAPR